MKYMIPSGPFHHPAKPHFLYVLLWEHHHREYPGAVGGAETQGHQTRHGLQGGETNDGRGNCASITPHITLWVVGLSGGSWRRLWALVRP
jgi:hypothetical protein